MKEVRKKQIYFWLCVLLIILLMYYNIKFFWPWFVKWCMGQ